MKKIGVVVGRFQIDRLHEGHRQLLKQVALDSDVLCVVLGVTENRGSRRNPLDFITRKLAVEYALKEEQIYPSFVILPLLDNASDTVWSTNLDTLLQQTFPGDSFTLYGGRDSFLKAYKGGLKTKELFLSRKTSSTERRAVVAANPHSTEEFRQGVIYGAYNQWPRLFMCVDVAPIMPDRKTLILGKRHNEDLYRFPGGFVDQTDASLEQAARREAKEEAGVDAETLQYVGSFKVPDHRYKTTDDGLIMSSFFIAWNMTEVHQAGDDLDELFECWFQDYGEVELLEFVVPAHRQHMSALLKVLRPPKVETL